MVVTRDWGLGGVGDRHAVLRVVCSGGIVYIKVLIITKHYVLKIRYESTSLLSIILRLLWYKWKMRTYI